MDFVFSFKVKEGKQDRNDQILAGELEKVKDEPGTLVYEIFRNENSVYCQHECYTDEAACEFHNQQTSELLQEWFEITEMQQIIVLDPLSDGFKKKFGIGNYLPLQG